MSAPLRALMAAAVLLAAAPATHAQPADPPAIAISGYVQPQIDVVRIDDTTRDRTFVRRAVVRLQVDVGKDWVGAMQVDVGPSITGDRPKLLDAYLRYEGWTAHGLTLTLGNHKIPFSRSVLLASSRRSFVERPFTGERAYGAPGRALAASIDGRHAGDHLQWAAAIGSVHHAPDVFELRLDGLADARDAWNEGLMESGRVEWHPRGAVPREQGDFTRGALRVMVGASVYRWDNDGDRNLFTTDGAANETRFADLDSAQAIELSGAVRAHGWSADVAWSRTSGDTIDSRFSGGIYDGGHAVLQQFGGELGYMLVPAKLEALGGLDTLAVAARTAVTYRPAFGMSWYVNGHRLKFSAMHREQFNALGLAGARARTTYVQAQYSF